MVECDSNIFIIYLVCDCMEEILFLIIECYVEKGVIIYSDGWLVYCKLNELGICNEYFMVIYKYFFKKIYVNIKIQDIVEVYINCIEGVWKYVKDYFRKLFGIKII